MNAHYWGSGAMVFSEGSFTGTAQNFVHGDPHVKVKWDVVGHLQRDAAGGVSAKFGYWDVFLQKRA